MKCPRCDAEMENKGKRSFKIERENKTYSYTLYECPKCGWRVSIS